MKQFNPPSPGEILLNDYMKPLKFSRKQMAYLLETTTKHLNLFLKGKVEMPQNWDVNLAVLFRKSPLYWLALEQRYQDWKKTWETMEL